MVWRDNEMKKKITTKNKGKGIQLIALIAIAAVIVTVIVLYNFVCHILKST